MTSSEDAFVGPAYAGAADGGVVSSVGAGDPAVGDIVAVLGSEHEKTDRVLAEVGELADAGDTDGLRLRFGGVVRELLEHQAAERRVVLPAVEAADPDGVGAVRREQARLTDLLGRYDALNPEVTPDEVRTVVDAVGAYERSVADVLVPLLATLPEDERRRLGEDLRQVKG